MCPGSGPLVPCHTWDKKRERLGDPLRAGRTHCERGGGCHELYPPPWLLAVASRSSVPDRLQRRLLLHVRDQAAVACGESGHSMRGVCRLRAGLLQGRCFLTTTHLHCASPLPPSWGVVHGPLSTTMHGPTMPHPQTHPCAARGGGWGAQTGSSRHLGSGWRPMRADTGSTGEARVRRVTTGAGQTPQRQLIGRGRPVHACSQARRAALPAQAPQPPTPPTRKVTRTPSTTMGLFSLTVLRQQEGGRAAVSAIR